MTIGSITFAPDQSKPCYLPAQVLAQAEVERLRMGNRQLLDQLRRAREWYIREYENEAHFNPIPPWEAA